MAPAQLSRQCRDNLGVGKCLGKLHHTVQVLGLEAAAKLFCQLLAQLGHDLGAVLGTRTTQHLGGQALADTPVQAFGVDSAGQALTAAGDEGTQFRVQVVRRRGSHLAQTCCVIAWMINRRSRS